MNLKVATIMDMERNEMNQVDGSKQFCPEDSKKKPEQSNKPGMAGFILALLSLVFCWVPVLNILLWIAGLIFSIIGITRTYKVFAAIGIGITCVSCVMILRFLIFYTALFFVANESLKYPTPVLTEEARLPSDGPDYIEIRGKKGYVSVYFGMPKDSVKLLLGKPDEVEYSKIGKEAHETWSYKIRNRYIADLRFEFRNGRMNRVDQD